MTVVRVDSGVCGFTTTITVRGAEDRNLLSVSLDSECEMVSSMAEDVAALKKMDAFVGFLPNPVYRAAARHLKHVACPVPSGILKALEVEAGFCVPRDAHIVFVEKHEEK
jgi:hypothetical protein